MRHQRGSVSGIDGMTCLIIMVIGGIALYNMWDGLSLPFRFAAIVILAAVGIFGLVIQSSGGNQWPRHDD